MSRAACWPVLLLDNSPWSRWRSRKITGERLLPDVAGEKLARIFEQFLVYIAIGVGFVLATVYQRYFTQWLTIRWRHWLTARYLDRWLDGSVHYRAMIVPGIIDNPDQRIAEDVRQFIDSTLSLTVGLLGEIARLFSFAAVLWTLSDLIPFNLFGQSYVIPGYLVWAALIYAVLGTAVTHWIGRSLIPLDFEQERREADFRFALVRLRENAEAVALLRGEASEKQELLSRFRAIMQNWFRLMARQQWVGLFTGAYRRFSVYFPYFAMAPLYFGGNMQLGAFMQSGSAFNQVRDAFSYFISSYLKIAELSAVVQRLAQFGATIESAGTDFPSHPQAPISGPNPITACHLVVSAPDGTSIVRLDQFAIARGEAILSQEPPASARPASFARSAEFGPLRPVTCASQMRRVWCCRNGPTFPWALETSARLSGRGHFRE